MTNININNYLLEFRFTVISDLCSIEPKTYTTNRAAATALGICKRQVQRLKKQFDGTIASLLHGNIGQKRVRKFSANLLTSIVQTVKDWNSELQDLKLPQLYYTHAYFKIIKQYEVEMSYDYFRKLMKDNGVLSPGTYAVVTDTRGMHLKTARKYKAGEEWQADGTFDFKLAEDDTSYCAHVIVDRGSNVIIACYLDYQETTNGYLNCFKQGFKEYGYPIQIAADKRTSFANNKASNDALTCLGQIFDSLNISMRLTSNPRSKNHVEAKNAIIKRQVMSELALAGARTIEEANELLPDIIKRINECLSNKIEEDNVHRKLEENFNYELIFSRQIVRKLSKQNIISVEGKEYFLHDSEGNVYKPRVKKKVNVHTSYNGNTFAMVGNQRFDMVLAYRENLLNFDCKECSSISRKIRDDNYTIMWKKKEYHFTGNSGVAVKFDWKDDVVLYYTYYKGRYTAKLAEIKGTKYQVKLGPCERTEDEYETKIYKTTNSQVITKTGVYALYSNTNQEVTLETDADILVEIKNGTPTSGILKNKKYKLINITTC